uniref:Glycoside hydrolase family 19 catalytic domain-containing protein n=1 Tax=Romanomermis culicivorax TaxID=13658 RepID=A0A915JQ41_ROMCU
MGNLFLLAVVELLVAAAPALPPPPNDEDKRPPQHSEIWTLLYYPSQKIFGQCGNGCPSGYKCVLTNCVLDITCKFPGKVEPSTDSCHPLDDPLNKPPSVLESWFTQDVFNDLFPKANIGSGPSSCLPYSYESFILASRYFPEFGAESPDNGFTAEQNQKRDLAAFFAHAIQETGENDISLYQSPSTDVKKADACFYRGGLFNWFEGGPVSSFLPSNKTGSNPSDGQSCKSGGQYCVKGVDFDYFFPCNRETFSGSLFEGCYFGRGPLQISYNFNYGQFQSWLRQQGLADVDLLKNPNSVLTSTDPPLAFMASLWFYMTPQPPKPSIHDILMGNWQPGNLNIAKGYSGAIFGPSSLVINNECNGEDRQTPGGPGESRRIKAFKWFCQYFGVPAVSPDTGGDERTLSCKTMPQKFDQISQNQSYQPNWQTTWKGEPCDCAPASYGGLIPYYQPGFYPDRFVSLNEGNRRRCVRILYSNPEVFYLAKSSECLKHPPPPADTEISKLKQISGSIEAEKRSLS